MALEIRLLPLHQLRVSENQKLELPSIVLAPSLENDLPHLKQIVISVTGTPSDLAAQIQSAYKDWGERSFNPPVKLSSAARVPRDECHWNSPLPSDVSCVLKVSIEYFNSDPTGQPDRSSPNPATTKCILFTPPSPSPPPIPPRKRMDAASNIDFPGWLAIDFGTSNSTVTLFDPRIVASPNELPKEQEHQLRKRLAEWLSQPAAAALPGISAIEWEAFVGDVSRDLEVADSSQLSALFLSSDSVRLLKAIRQIELYGGSERFHKAASKRLNQIYHEVFRVPPMQWQSLIPVRLDADRRASEIPSEIEILSLDEPLKLNMGESTWKRRMEAIKTTKSTTWNEIKARFHHSPKRYFGQNHAIVVTLDGKEKPIPINRLIQAAWSHLIELTEACRRDNPGEFSDGRFNTAVITYPTIAPPVVRREIEQLVSELKIQDIQTAYDEAVSVAIFFLWREFGGDLTIGIESFKTRCRYNNGKWSQNVLVLDIGGGTTDIALIRLTLEEINPFDPGEDQGDGGRYYILTPQIQGSSGHLQLGGELITLRVFLLLKAAIADCLLSANSTGDLHSDFLEGRLMGLNQRFIDNDRFNSGSLLGCLDKEYPESDSSAYKDALDTAEQVLPTRWLNASARLQAFYTLWEYAEQAKLKLGQPSTLDTPEPFVLSEVEISELLEQSGIDYQVKNPNSLKVTMSRQQFERAALPVVREAIGIAKGLMESRLRKQEAAQSPHDSAEEDSAEIEDLATTEASQPLPEQVDWLILSGKTCNLDLVKQESYQQFSKSRYFVWNPERITFVPEHTKLATSAGACYAEKLRRLIFDPKESKDLLRRGANQLYVNVKNLFYYLPCAFELSTQDRLLSIFEAGQELYQLDPHETVAKVRSDRWLGMPLSIILYRKDFEEMTPQLWGSYSGKALQDRLDVDEFEFRSKIKVQFEIDHTLQFKLLLCQQMPHYWIAADLPSIDLKSALSKSAGESDIFKDGILCCNIAINVAEGANAHKTDVHTLIFEGGKDYSSSLNVFQSEDGPCQGLISDPLDNFPKSGKHTFYFHNAETDNWVRIGELSRPNVTPEYTCKYYITLDEQGILRVHAGAVPYWMSEDENCLKQEGCVFKAELDLQPNDVDEKRDPFCGIH